MNKFCPLFYPVNFFLFSGCAGTQWMIRSEEHTSELQSLTNLVCRLLLEKKNMQFDLFNCVLYLYLDNIYTMYGAVFSLQLLHVKYYNFTDDDAMTIVRLYIMHELVA